MGSQTLPARANGSVVDDAWFNTPRSALLQDLFARNSSGVVTDQAGSLGSATYRWLSAFLMNLYIMNGSNYLKFVAPTLTSNLTFTWPAAFPASKLPMRMSTAGVIDVDTITRAMLASLGQQLSSSSGAFTTTSGSYADVTNLSVTITTGGRPVIISLVGDGTTNSADFGVGSDSNFKLLRDSTDLHVLQSNSARWPAAALWYFDPVAAGTYTYKLQAKKNGGTTPQVNYCKLLAYEV